MSNFFGEYELKIYQEELIKTQEKEKELLRLLQVKSEKIANEFLIKSKHTQLSYMSKEEQKIYLGLPKGIILNKLINYLRTL